MTPPDADRSRPPRDIPSDPPVRVLAIVARFPEHTETFVGVELEALASRYAIRVVSYGEPRQPGASALPHERVALEDSARLKAVFDEFRPQILHTHFLSNARVLAQLAAHFGVPFTVRTHSFDVVTGPSTFWPSFAAVEAVEAVNGEHCLGVLAFAHYREVLERAGVRPDRIIDAPPVVDFERFHDTSANGDAIMAAGPANPERRMTDLVDLAARLPGHDFDLYCLGDDADLLAKYNRERGAPATVHRPVAHRDMPPVYKRHRWLVHSASPLTGGSGWPVSVVEAQASGLGVCVPYTHARCAEPLGGAGFVYRHVAEAAEILSRPYPEDMRERGFEVARRCDVRRHGYRLTDLWDAALDRRPARASR